VNIDLSTSKIIISNNPNTSKAEVLKQLSAKIVKLFEKDDFLLEDAKIVAKEAYISESEIKYLLIIANSFNIYAQNSLLKMLEEPPKNTIFIIISNSKTNFLPTIRSRIQIITHTQEKRDRNIELNLSKMNLNDIFNFIKNNQRITKSKIKELIQDIFYEALHKHDIRFTKNEIAVFENALQLAELNTRAEFLLSSILLTIFNRQNK